jgi:hypothetical protein
MKKFYSIVLMATALLIGTNTWAVEVATLAELQAAIATPNAEITLTANITMPTAGGTIDFNDAIIDCNGKRLNATKAKTYTLQNATFIKNTSNYGAIYVSGAATVNLENITATSGKYGVRLNKAGVVLNVDASSALVGSSYGVYVGANASINNEGDVKSIYTASDAVTVNIINNGTLNQACGNKGVFNLENEGDATITAGTFEAAVSFTGTNPVNILGGTFNLEPTGDNALINPGDGVVKFAEGVGSLAIASGYAWRAFDQLVVRSDAGVVEVTRGGSSFTCLVEEAFANAQDGDKITLIEDVTSYSSCWLGTAEANGAFRSVTLDLNGHTLSSASNVKNTIELTHGALYIKNSVPGQGAIYHARSNAASGSSEIIRIVGSPDRMQKGGEYINPRNAAVEDLFVYLLIDEGVTLEADGNLVNGITVIENMPSGNTLSQLNYYTNSYSGAKNSFSVANGVRIDIKGTVNATKYAGKINGNIRHPNEMIHDYPGMTDAQIGDTANSTFVHIFPTAVMHTSDAVEATAVYSSGYGRWQIEGLCQGATGIYVKSGVVDITNAVIESTYTGPASITTGKGSGIDAGGNAIVIESNNHYTGQQAIVIGGDTKISTEAAGGAAVVDIVDDTHDTKVESIVINGGTFTGDNAIVISSETASENSTTVNGVTVTGEISVGGSTDPAAVAEIMGADTHTTVIENPDGTTTVVVSAGAAPTAATEWVDVAALAAGSDANWTGFTPGVIGDGTTATTVTLGELQIISGNAIDGNQELTIMDKATLKVNKLIMNDFARIIVEAGGKLIVEGEQGINAPVVENITLKNEEGKHSIFLFNPAVTSNRHPNALFEILSYSWRVSATEAQSEVFGVPTHNAIKSVACLDAGKWGYLQVYNQKGDWDNIAFTDDDPFPYDKLNKPFAAYALTAYRLPNEDKLSFQFGGELVGNVDATLTANLKWSFFANSYTAEVDLAQFLTGLETTAQNVDKTIYVAGLNGGGYWTWEALGIEEVVEDHVLTKLQPMQGFLLNNKGGHVESNGINYKSMVYDPYFPSASPAPRRMAANNNTAKMFVVVTNEVGAYDNVKLRETENTKSAEKFMNQDVNIYATAEEKSAILAAENLADTYVGFSTVKGGNFTISFTNVMGREFDLVDLETGARVAVAEGFEYNFTADANYANDYRFKIVERHFAPTGIENTEAVKNAKGIFTITGQYVGEMNVWNTLPAGVYVVNGEKRVK